MTDVYFPANIVPTVTSGYDFGTPDNILQIDVMGGMPIQVLDYRTGPIPVGLMVTGDTLIKQVMSDFFYGKLVAGSGKFYITIDTGNGMLERVVQIMPGSIRFDGGQGPIWNISFTVLCETTPEQADIYGGALVDAYEIWGADTPDHMPSV
jgi:hypothetical protein